MNYLMPDFKSSNSSLKVIATTIITIIIYCETEMYMRPMLYKFQKNNCIENNN